MKPATVPAFLRMFVPGLIWQKPAGEKKIYLTFDDGPDPEVTPAVLGLLGRYNALATFFCVGQNVERHPEVFAQTARLGHLQGNHSYNHLNGWKTPLGTYYDNVMKCRELVNSAWFRPPYGRITPAQIHTLRKEFNIVMWSVLSYDFDQQITGEECLQLVMRHAGDGSIVVFHDSLKAAPRMLFALEHTLQHFSELGYRFCRLDDQPT
ncbi:MAG: polysaccharide deacetylase family protein [Bacteroidetes bacterium]|nr:polysaccharide deacetylase family protein [Bacteroidota bacterium]